MKILRKIVIQAKIYESIYIYICRKLCFKEMRQNTTAIVGLCLFPANHLINDVWIINAPSVAGRAQNLFVNDRLCCTHTYVHLVRTFR